VKNLNLSDDALALELAEQWRGRFAYDHCSRRWRILCDSGWESVVPSISKLFASS
jgi:hypothetical protein